MKFGVFVDDLGMQRALVLYLTKPPTVSGRQPQQLHLVRLSNVAPHIAAIMDINKQQAGNGYEVWTH